MYELLEASVIFFMNLLGAFTTVPKKISQHFSFVGFLVNCEEAGGEDQCSVDGHCSADKEGGDV